MSYSQKTGFTSVKSKASSAISAAEKRINTRNFACLLKLLFVGIIIFLLISISLNIYQALEDDCRDIERKVDRLSEENDRLEQTAARLREAQLVLNATIDDFVSENLELEENILALEEEEAALKNNLESLREVESELNKTISDFDVDFAGFEDRVETLFENFQAESDRGIELSNRVEELEENFRVLTVQFDQLFQETIRLNDEFEDVNNSVVSISRRDDILSSLIKNEVRDSQLGFTQFEYDTFIGDLDLYFTDAEVTNIQSEFPFQNFEYDEVKEISNRETLSN